MANEDKVEVELSLVTSGALKALDGLKSSFSNTFKSINPDLGKVGTGLTDMAKNLFSVKNAAIAAGTAVVTYLGSKQVLDKAIAQEEAVNSVALALARTGEYSKASLRDMENYAKQLQLQTAYGDEEILKQVSLAQAFGATAEQAKVITRASIELAAATGKSLDEATRQVSKTLGGFAGELGEVNPRIKALSQEQLKNGEAARILLEQYGGTAIGKIKTFNGALEQNKNVFTGLLEQVGFLITKNPVVIEGINALSKIFSQMADYLETNREAIIAFVNEGLVAILNAAPKIGSGLKFIVDLLAIMAKSTTLAAAGAIELLRILLQFDTINKIFEMIVQGITIFTREVLNLISVFAGLPGVKDTLEAMGVSVEGVQTAIAEANLATTNWIDDFSADKVVENLGKAEDTLFGIAEGTEDLRVQIKRAIDEGAASAQNLAKKVKAISQQGQVELKVVNNEESVKKSFDNYQQFMEAAFNGAGGAKIGNALVNGIASGLKNGKEGARAMLSSLAGAAADAFLPGLGQAVGPLIDALSMGPDAVRQMVKDFMGALPDLISAIIESIPVIIEEFANQLPIIIERLAEKAPEIITALVNGMPKAIWALQMSMPKVALSFATNLIKNLPKIVSEFAKAVYNAVSKALAKLTGGLVGKDSSKPGGGGVKGAVTTGPTSNGYVNAGLNVMTGGASGLVSRYTGIKFAKGGEVPGGYPNDTAHTMLSSGELVIDRSTNSDLKKYLAKNGGGNTDALLTKVIDLLERPMTFKTEAKLNNKSFADFILHANRTNLRTS